MSEFNGLIFNIYDILNSKIGDANHNYSMTHQLGTINTTGNNKPGDVYSDGAQLWAIVGVTSMPASPNGSQDCAQSISVSTSDYDMVLGTRDTRFQSFVSDIAPGDLYLYSSSSNPVGIKIKAADNSIHINSGTITIGNVTGTPGTLTFAAWSQDLLNILKTFMTNCQAYNPFASTIISAATTASTQLNSIADTLGTTDTKAT